MEILARYATRSEAEERAAFLKSRGVASYVTDVSSLRHNAAHRGNDRAFLWCLLADQFEDATALLDNPDYAVSRPLTEDQMRELESDGPKQARATILKYTLMAGAVALVALVLTLAALSTSNPAGG